MISAALLLSFLAIADFSSFTYCHENMRGPYELQCIQLDPDAKGEVKFKRRQAETVNMAIQLSPAGRQKFLALLAATNFLEHPETFESGRKIADLGAKHLTIETPGGKREGTFNFSLRKDVTDLSNFFEGLINQETLGFDIENAMKFERLSIPKRLEQAFGVGPVGLVPQHIRAHNMGWHEHDSMTGGLRVPGPMVRRSTRLHQDDRRCVLAEKAVESCTRQAMSLPYLPGMFGNSHLENRLRYVDRDRRTIHVAPPSA